MHVKCKSINIVQYQFRVVITIFHFTKEHNAQFEIKNNAKLLLKNSYKHTISKDNTGPTEESVLNNNSLHPVIQADGPANQSRHDIVHKHLRSPASICN
jgi:hypothetical protein